MIEYRTDIDHDEIRDLCRQIDEAENAVQFILTITTLSAAELATHSGLTLGELAQLRYGAAEPSRLQLVALSHVYLLWELGLYGVEQTPDPSPVFYELDYFAAHQLVARWNELANDKHQLEPDQAHLLFGENADADFALDGQHLVELRASETKSGNPATFYITASELAAYAAA